MLQLAVDEVECESGEAWRCVLLERARACDAIRTGEALAVSLRDAVESHSEEKARLEQAVAMTKQDARAAAAQADAAEDDRQSQARDAGEALDVAQVKLPLTSSLPASPSLIPSTLDPPTHHRIAFTTGDA